MTSTEIERAKTQTPAVPTHDEINRTWRMAEALAASGIFPDARSTGTAFAKMLVGHDLGLSPTQALMSIHIVEGKPLVGYTLLGGFIKRIPGYDYRVREHDETRCVIDFFIDGETVGTSEFTIEDAKTAGLIKDKGAWKKYPRTMVLARALSQGVRWYMPDATGGVPVYSEDEIEERAQLTDGESDGTVAGIDLGPKVEKVLARARDLGHSALADRGTAEMTLGNRSPQVAADWCRNAEAELDALEPADADVVDPAAEALRLIGEAVQLDADADEADDLEDAAKLREAAAKLREQAATLQP